jgi:hypothetical protein
MSARTSLIVLLAASAAAASAPVLAQFRFGGERRDRELIARYDQDGDGYLDRAERDAARGRTLSTEPRATYFAFELLIPADLPQYCSASLQFAH